MKLLDILFPRRCIICDRLNLEGYICHNCANSIRVVKDPFCLKCGKAIEDESREYCLDCMKREHYFKSGRSLLVYDDLVSHSIYRFKYAGRKEYAIGYARLSAKVLGDYIRFVSPDYLIPVPLHFKRYHKRGYNQSALYAKELSKLLDIPFRDDIVKRVKNTRPQKELGVLERQNNLKKAFKINKNDVKLKTIILIDDIYTTGSTMDAISSLLLSNGASEIYCISIACRR